MKQFILGFGVFLMASLVMADSFYCTLYVGEDYDAVQSETRNGQIVVKLTSYKCEGTFLDGHTEVLLFEPGETDVRDAAKASANKGEAVTVTQGPASCTCGLN